MDHMFVANTCSLIFIGSVAQQLSCSDLVQPVNYIHFLTQECRLTTPYVALIFFSSVILDLYMKFFPINDSAQYLLRQSYVNMYPMNLSATTFCYGLGDVF